MNIHTLRHETRKDTTVTTPQLTTNALGRRIPTDAELHPLIAAALSAACNASRSFSAKDIKDELRNANPDLEIEHSRVRDAVHAAMRVIIGAGAYDAQHGAYVLYVPTQAPTPAYAPPAAPGAAQSPTAAPATTPASGGDTAQLSGLPLLPIPGQGA